MATRQKRSRTRSAARPVFEDFSPVSKWKREEESHILLIYLPGFVKENIKVTAEGLNIVRVQGERQVASNKWRRFQEDFQVPEACDVRGVQARFDGGILTITLPNMTTTPTAKSRLVGILTDEPTAAPTPPSHQDVTSTKPISQKTTDEIKEKHATDTVPAVGTRGEVPKPAIMAKPKKSDEEEIKSGAAGKLGKDREESDQVVGSKVMVGRVSDRENAEKKKDVIGAGNVGETSTRGGAGGGDDYGLEREKHKKRRQPQKVVKRLNEERQLTVNMGVAALVLVAFGAYLSYTWCSSGTGSEGPEH